jgi:hypothetical protein
VPFHFGCSKECFNLTNIQALAATGAHTLFTLTDLMLPCPSGFPARIFCMLLRCGNFTSVAIDLWTRYEGLRFQGVCTHLDIGS